MIEQQPDIDLMVFLDLEVLNINRCRGTFKILIRCCNKLQEVSIDDCMVAVEIEDCVIYRLFVKNTHLSKFMFLGVNDIKEPIFESCPGESLEIQQLLSKRFE